MNVLIMAGGRGLRLHPITDRTPKPLIRVGSKPILRTIVDGLVEHGFHDIWMAVRYKHELIRAYFGDGAECGARIRYLLEDEPLDTGGALKLMPEGPCVVTNADVLVKVNYRRLVEEHQASGCLATMCVALHQAQIHYGVVQYDSGRMTDIREKPIASWPVNAGIYVIEEEAHRHMPRGPFPIIDMLMNLPARTVNIFELEDFWLDIGRFEDLGRAVALSS